MPRLPLIMLAVLAAAAACLIVATSGRLPEPVATHFGRGDLADAWMTRAGYRAWMVAFVVLLPACVAGLIGALPRAWPGLVNVPNRAYWLAPERRSRSLDFLAGAGCWLGCLLVALGTGVHLIVLEANAVVPAQLPRAPFFALMGCFGVALAAWIAAFYRRFRRVDAGD